MASHKNLNNTLDRVQATAGKRAVAFDGVDKNHLFVNNVRFLSMAAIIAIHTINSYSSAVAQPTITPLLRALHQPLKFGTIGFFLVSGFLFGERIQKHSPFGYFKRRLQNVFAPWLVWLSLYFALRTGASLVHGRLSGVDLWQGFTNCLIYSAFWFVPNLLIALALLLVFGRFLNNWRTGLVFLLASLFYGANIYGHWIPVLHTQAVFGFVFYLWLGAWSAWHFPSIEKWLARIPTVGMLGLTLFALLLALAESRLLVTLGSIDPTNTLRISNQIFSIVAVLTIVRLKRGLWPRFVDAREHTFGLYLTHTAALTLICWALRHILTRFDALSWATSNTGTLILVPVIFALTYSGCLLVVVTLRANRMLRWTVGLATQRKAANLTKTLVETKPFESPGALKHGVHEVSAS